MLILAVVKKGKKQHLGWRIIEAIPIILPAVLAGFSCVVVTLLVAGRLSSPLVWSFGGLISALIAWRLWRKLPVDRPGGDREKRLTDLLVLIGVGIWIIFNLFFTAQSVFVTRDPGIYTVTAKWLTNHQKSDIPTRPIKVFENNLINYSSGIWLSNTPTTQDLQPQGSHLLSAILGMAGRLFGVMAIYKFNVVLGGIALLAVYAFARQMLRPRWAALAVAILGLSLPMIYFSRDTYTEMLAAIFTFGALTLVWLAQSTKKRALELWAAAGLTAGAAVMSRPDGFFPTIVILFCLTLAIILAKKKDRLTHIYYAIAFFICAAIPMIIGWFDITHLTRSYYLSVHKELKIQIGLIILEIIAGAILIYICLNTKFLKKLDKSTKNWRVKGAAIFVGVGFLLLMARPILFYEIDHRVTNVGSVWGTFIQPLLRGVSSPRYAWDLSMEWIGWYVGLPMLVLGIVGLALGFAQSMKDKKLLLLPGVLLVGLMALVYGLEPKITADQIWAIRRFLPVILPGFVVFGVFALQKIADAIPTNEWKKVFMPMAIIFILMQPLLVSRPFLGVTEKADRQQTLLSFCAALPKNSEVVWLGNSSRLDAVQSIRAYCGLESWGYIYNKDQFATGQNLNETDLANIAKQIRQRGHVPVIAMHQSQRPLFNMSITDKFTTVVKYGGLVLETPIYGPPREAVSSSETIDVAIIGENGQLTAFPVKN